MADTEEELAAGMASAVARMDDAFWAARIRRPFTWQGYLDWFVSRRWLMPRDVRKW
jgi:hypothetical protein